MPPSFLTLLHLLSERSIFIKAGQKPDGHVMFRDAHKDGGHPLRGAQNKIDQQLVYIYIYFYRSKYFLRRYLTPQIIASNTSREGTWIQRAC